MKWKLILFLVLCLIVIVAILVSRFCVPALPPDRVKELAGDNLAETNQLGAGSMLHPTNATTAISRENTNLKSVGNPSNEVTMVGGTLASSKDTNSELFKVVLDTNTGIYFSTDTGKQNLYRKMKDGKIFSVNNIAEFLHIPPIVDGKEQKISSMVMLDGHLVIVVGNSNYVIGASGSGRGQNGSDAVLANTDQPRSLFKVDINSGPFAYAAVKPDKETIYFVNENGATTCAVNFLDHLKANTNFMVGDDKISAMKLVDGNLEVTVGGRNYPLIIRPDDPRNHPNN